MTEQLHFLTYGTKKCQKIVKIVQKEFLKNPGLMSFGKELQFFPQEKTNKFYFLTFVLILFRRAKL